MKVVLRVAVILFTAAVLERGLFSQLRIDGVAADVLLLVAISAGMVGGSDDGAVVGFFAGLTLDLLVQTPLGLSALAYCVTGYVVGDGPGGGRALDPLAAAGAGRSRPASSASASTWSRRSWWAGPA